MNKRKLFWPFFGAHVLILLLAISSVSFYTWHTSREIFHRQWVHELQVQAHLAAVLLPQADGVLDEARVRRFFEKLEKGGEHRFTVILPNGKVIGDTDVDSTRMELHDDRPEVIEAMSRGQGESLRYSASMGKQMLYLAQRVPLEGGPPKAVVRVSVPMRTLTRDMHLANRFLGVLPLIVLLSALVLSYVAALRIIGPVSELQKGLSRIGEGDLTYRLPIPPAPHLAELARSINQTADRLQTYIRALNDERNLRTLILANMTRGVIAIDARHVILDLNDSARKLLDLSHSVVEGVQIGEVVRYPEFLKLISTSEQADEPVEMEMLAGVNGDVQLNMRATALKDAAGKRMGTLLVLSNVTLLRRLETIRQDFVANVSHELRTPVTSVKGFAEALLDGAMQDPETAEHFLKIIVRQANQLESIIRDLLELSRLEQNAAHVFERQVTPVAGVLKSAVELCHARAEARQVEVVCACEDGLTAVMHSGLMEQALVNLIDNAIKYGVNGPGARVEVSALRQGDFVRIEVRDFGPGIEHAHLDRLFERFYRVDKGRSRELGGTGLGLAIVKHIVLIHNGTVSVESELGKGARFTMLLPV